MTVHLTTRQQVPSVLRWGKYLSNLKLNFVFLECCMRSNIYFKSFFKYFYCRYSQGYTVRWYSEDLFDIQSSYEAKLTGIKCYDDEWESCRYSLHAFCFDWENVFLDCKGNKYIA